MKAGSERKDCLAAFLVRCVEGVGALVVVELVAGGVDDDGLMLSPLPGSPPPAAKAGIAAGLAATAPRNTVSITRLIGDLIMQLSFSAFCRCSCAPLRTPSLCSYSRRAVYAHLTVRRKWSLPIRRAV